jgi:hypothetical protein
MGQDNLRVDIVENARERAKASMRKTMAQQGLVCRD